MYTLILVHPQLNTWGALTTHGSVSGQGPLPVDLPRDVPIVDTSTADAGYRRVYNRFVSPVLKAADVSRFLIALAMVGCTIHNPNQFDTKG